MRDEDTEEEESQSWMVGEGLGFRSKNKHVLLNLLNNPFRVLLVKKREERVMNLMMINRTRSCHPLYD